MEIGNRKTFTWVVLGCTALILVFVLVLGVPSIKAAKPALSKIDAACIQCHKKEQPKIIEQYNQSKHAKTGVGCMSCHTAKKGDFDALEHEGQLVAQHPRAKTCATCHAQQAKEFWESKHAAIGIHQAIDANANWRKTPIVNKTMGCVYCHNGMGNYWPDKTVGRCDKCHARHTFSVEFARQPETCGECHRGEDHGNYTSFVDSKHGEIWSMDRNKWNWSYKPGAKLVPFSAPACATCHMSGAPGLKPTHNISERLAWRQVSPLAYRTNWGEGTWEEKRARMEKVCAQCHVGSNIAKWFLGVDLAFYQFNEIVKPFFVMRTKLNEMGKLTSKNDDDDRFDIILREVWHDVGRVYRASLTHFAPNVNEAYGYSPLTYKCYELIEIAAEKGLKEAEEWMHQNDQDKVHYFPALDYGGLIWAPSYSALTNNYWYKKPDWWQKVTANVETLAKNNIISEKQWQLWQKMFAEQEKYVNKTEADFPPQHKFYMDNIQKGRDAQKKVQALQLPGRPYFDKFYQMMAPKAEQTTAPEPTKAPEKPKGEEHPKPAGK